jgi:tRNA uridine 5-carboxymethylaminomethyl modification enzyme
MFQEEYDVIVVGAGALDLASSRRNLGSKTLITMSLQNIAQMSCNPAMGELPRNSNIRD